MGANGNGRPDAVMAKTIGPGETVISLPPEFTGEVRLMCTGGGVQKVMVQAYFRPTDATDGGEKRIELVEGVARKR